MWNFRMASVVRFDRVIRQLFDLSKSSTARFMWNRQVTSTVGFMWNWDDSGTFFLSLLNLIERDSNQVKTHYCGLSSPTEVDWAHTNGLAILMVGGSNTLTAQP